ncbi:MAG: hypothetical protein CMK99_16610 [Pseudomonas sp.]|nr:hypothetical protein [Pseudomonas sp.]HBS79572.1 hypothetical protein [Pseudomonas sp.]
MLRITLGYLLFLLVYYLPAYADLSAYSTLDNRSKYLFFEALTHQTVLSEIARNFATHISLTAILYIACIYTGKRASVILRCSDTIAASLTITLATVTLFLYHSLYFPLSQYSAFLDSTPDVIAPIAAITLIILISISLFQTSWSKRILFASGFCVMTLAAYSWPINEIKQENGHPANVIIIGIDSLSETTLNRAAPQIPNIAKMFSSGDYFSNTYTNIGRTFPAWVSILTGAPPSTSGALFNLRNLEKINSSNSLPRDLHALGYKTIYAMDERRFSNIDESFGFDLVLGPKAGLLDFVLQVANDTPLTNIALQFHFSSKLLPFSRINVAAHSSYDAQGFIHEIEKNLPQSAPVFLAVHLESAHFPYKTRHAPDRKIDDFYTQHLNSLIAVDKQIAQLFHMLEKTGHLQNSIIVALADHGESFGNNELSYTKNGIATNLNTYGHGTSILSDLQNHIPMGILKFENGNLKSSERVEELHSLLDVRKLISDALLDRPYQRPINKCVIVETGIRFSSALDYKTIDPAKIAAESSNYYQTTRNGQLALKEEKLHLLAANKDIGIRCIDSITYFDSSDHQYYAYRIRNGNLIETTPKLEATHKIEQYRSAILSNTDAYASPQSSLVIATPIR